MRPPKRETRKKLKIQPPLSLRAVSTIFVFLSYFLDIKSYMLDFHAKLKRIWLMKYKPIWIAAFLFLYGVHAAAMLAGKGAFAPPLSDGVVEAAALISLAGLFLLTGAYIALSDEVQRGIALTAAGISALTTAGVFYPIDALALAPGPLFAKPWAFLFAIFLIAYGALQWRARS
ncbi:MAG: hypothetical protein CMI63_03740 [Parvularcula sp.]|nr:hypothetical protein [Parvularcula sp.]